MDLGFQANNDYAPLHLKTCTEMLSHSSSTTYAFTLPNSSPNRMKTSQKPKILGQGHPCLGVYTAGPPVQVV